MLTHNQKRSISLYVNRTAKANFAVARATGDKLRTGNYHFLPVVGRVMKNETGHSILFLSGLLFWPHSIGDRTKGGLGWAIPLTRKTLPVAAQLLATLGWDGRLWPTEAGWPDGQPESVRATIEQMLKEAEIPHTMVFPPTSKGLRLLNVLVAKGGGEVFPLDPEISADDRFPVSKSLIDRLEGFMLDPSTFAA